MPSAELLATVASIITAFGAAMLFFRIQRELEMGDLGEVNWLPWSDRLLLVATLMCLLLVLIPTMLIGETKSILTRLPLAANTTALVLVAGYIFGILAHYRLFFGTKRTGKRENPEPAEKVIVFFFGLVAVAVFAILLFDLAN